MIIQRIKFKFSVPSIQNLYYYDKDKSLKNEFHNYVTKYHLVIMFKLYYISAIVIK